MKHLIMLAKLSWCVCLICSRIWINIFYNICVNFHVNYPTRVMLIRDNNCPSLVWNFIIVDNDHWSWSKLDCRDKLITDQPIRFKNYGPKIKYVFLKKSWTIIMKCLKLFWLLYMCVRNFVLHNVIAFFGWKSFENDKTKIYLC